MIAPQTYMQLTAHRNETYACSEPRLITPEEWNQYWPNEPYPFTDGKIREAQKKDYRTYAYTEKDKGRTKGKPGKGGRRK